LRNKRDGYTFFGKEKEYVNFFIKFLFKQNKTINDYILRNGTEDIPNRFFVIFYEKGK
jgi:hypothetical protein